VFNAQINGMVFQLTWIFGLWALLRAIGCSPRAAFQIVLCLIPTGVLYANSIFVWPKLCAASFALGMTAMLCFRDTRKLTLPEAAVAGVLLSLGMLCHSGIFFFVLPVLGLWVVLPSASGRPGITAVLVLILMSGTLFYPWTRYQKDYDPPGNHLLKLSFAGVVDDDSITTWKSIQGAYSALTGQEILRNKQANFITPFKGNWSTIFQPFPAEADHSYHSPDLAEFGGARGQCRFDNFFFIFRSCGVLLLGLFALPLLIRPANAYLRRPVLFLTTSLAISLLLWCLLMFGPGTTIIHAGAYGVPLVILTLLALLIRSVHPLALLIVGVYNFVQFIWVYAWMYPYPPRVDPLAAAAILLAIGISIAVLAFGLKIPRRANARAGRAVVAVPTAT
jgi:multisubunit Na+/H+ antiporter MnhC subunit